MFLKYELDGVPPRKWQFTLDKLLSVEAEALERQTGWVFPAEFGQQLVKGSIIARKALLWVFLKREDPTLLYRQVDPPAGAIGTDFERGELVLIREQVERSTDMPDEQRTAMLAQFDELIAGEPELPDPKVPGNDGASSG